MSAIGTLAEAVIKLLVDGSKLKSGLDTAKADTSKATEQMAGMVRGLARAAEVAFVASTGAITGFTRAFAASEQSATRLEFALKRIGEGGALDQVSERLSAMALKMGQDDEMLADQLAKLTLRTHSSADAFTALEAAQNLAAGTGRTLEEAVQAIQRAYGGSTMMLERWGVSLSEGAKGMQVVSEVNQKFAGEADEMSKKTSAALGRMAEAGKNLAEDIGSFLAPTVVKISEDFSKWTAALTDTQKQAMATGLITTAAMTGVIGPLARATDMVLQFRIASSLAKLAADGGAAATASWGSQLIAFAKGPVGIAIAALIALVQAANSAVRAMTEAQNVGAGGPVATSLDANGNPVMQSPAEMDQETGSYGFGGVNAPGNAIHRWAMGRFTKGQMDRFARGGMNVDMPTDIYGKPLDFANSLDQLKKQNRALREHNADQREWQARRASNSHASSVREQLAGATGIY